MKNVIICGLGAIGSVFAVKISDYDKTVLSVLLDKERFERYKNTPTLFNGKQYDFNYITPDSLAFEADLIILATKNNGLAESLSAIKNFVGKDTIILSFLNGIKSEEQIAQVYGEDKILYSYYIGHTSSRVGRNIEHDDIYEIVFGEKNKMVPSYKVRKVRDFFEKSHINYKIPDDMDYARWWKFLLNVGYNQASAVLNADYGVFQNCTNVNDFAIKLMEEAALIAQACGVKAVEKMIPEILEVIKTMRPEARTSMLQDVDAKRETEVDIFAGYVIDLGRKFDIKTPYNNMFYDLIKALDEKIKQV